MHVLCGYQFWCVFVSTNQHFSAEKFGCTKKRVGISVGDYGAKVTIVDAVLTCVLQTEVVEKIRKKIGEQKGINGQIRCVFPHTD